MYMYICGSPCPDTSWGLTNLLARVPKGERPDGAMFWSISCPPPARESLKLTSQHLHRTVGRAVNLRHLIMCPPNARKSTRQRKRSVAEGGDRIQLGNARKSG